MTESMARREREKYERLTSRPKPGRPTSPACPSSVRHHPGECVELVAGARPSELAVPVGCCPDA